MYVQNEINLFTLNDTYEATIYKEVELKTCIYISTTKWDGDTSFGTKFLGKNLGNLAISHNLFHWVYNNHCANGKI